MINLTHDNNSIAVVPEPYRDIMTMYLKDLHSGSLSVLLDELGANSFEVVYLQARDEVQQHTDSKNVDNIVNNAVNVVSDPSNNVFFVFSEPSNQRVMTIYTFVRDLCSEEFLRFIEFIHDDVDDEEDDYIPPYEVCQI